MVQRHTEAINHFHGLMSANLSEAEDQLVWLDQAQRDHGILFGDRPLANSLRPIFLTEDLYTEVHETVYLVRQAVLKIAAAFFNDEHTLRVGLGLEDWEIELAAIPTNIIRLAATARMDAFVTPNSFKFVEINGEVPAGIAYIHTLGRLYRSLPIFEAFERQFPVRFVSPLEHTVSGLLQIYHEQFDGKEERPSFAVVDMLDVPTIHEFHLIKDYLDRFGYACEIVDPRDLTCHDGWVVANGRRIDILYRRLLMNEYHAIKDDCPAFLEGYRAGKTCYLNSFRTKLVHKKAIFSFLTDERYTHILNHQESQAIADHIPWTRRLIEQRTSFRGLSIDLVDFVRANKRHFVIKPNDEYGGKSVTLGFAASDSEWDAAIAEGLLAGHVVQECVDIHREPFLMYREGSWSRIPTIVDLDPYLNGPLMGGCLTRISGTNLANVTAGGGTLPAFILRYT